MAEENDEAATPQEIPAKPRTTRAAKPKSAEAASAETAVPAEAAAPAEVAATAETAAPAAAAAAAPAKAAATTKARTDKAGTAKAAGSAEVGSSKAEAPKAAADADSPQRSVGHGGTLRVHHLRPAPGAHTRKERVGRGEGSKGKTAGRGTKGTKARYQVPGGFEGGQMPLHMRLPKLRGFTNPFRVEYQVVNLDKLTALYPQGGDVTVADLVAKGAVRKGAPVKVLGTGEVTVKLAVTVDALSASAEEKILAAGGSVAKG